MSVNLYPVGRNFDGTGYSPLYRSQRISDDQYRFMSPTGNQVVMKIETVATTTVTFCNNAGTSNLYKLIDMYVVVDPSDGRIFLTAAGTIPPSVYTYHQAYLASMSGVSVVMFENTTTDINVATSTFYTSSSVEVGDHNYLTANIGTFPACSGLTFIGGAVVVSDGICYLIPAESLKSFYTQAVPGPSFYFVVESGDYASLPTDMKSMVISGPVGQTVGAYVNLLLGVVPTPTTAVSNTPSPSSGSNTALTPEQAAAVKKRASNISFYIMLGSLLFILALAILALIVYIVTRPKKFPYDKPLKYDAPRKTLYDA